MQDAKNVFYMYEKKVFFICQINKIKSINFWSFLCLGQNPNFIKLDVLII